MGGDGGVIASNRKYMRGAGSADHTADARRDKNDEKESMLERMRTCHVTKTPLSFRQSIVACAYGRLYSKEAAVEALLRRKQSEKDELGSHVRGLKDLYPVHFHLTTDAVGNDVPTCPVTGVELNGNHPAFLIHNKKNVEQPNVLSERAVKEIGMEALQADYGPFESENMIRLAPPESMMEEIREAVAKKHELEKTTKKSSKKDGKKRKKTDEVLHKSKALKTSSVADAARMRVASAVASNDVLSSLFTSKTGSVSEKEKHNNLFARP
jgi:hypothetical protein